MESDHVTPKITVCLRMYAPWIFSCMAGFNQCVTCIELG